MQGCTPVSAQTWVVEDVKARHWAMQLSRTGPSGRRQTRTPLQALEEDLRSLPEGTRSLSSHLQSCIMMLLHCLISLDDPSPVRIC